MLNYQLESANIQGMDGLNKLRLQLIDIIKKE